MLPEPALTLTLPSLNDGLALDCRVYHPQSLAANPRAPPWKRHAAVIAHPYAPLGGSFDDPIVDTVATQLLRNGYLVGTFNFRGAGNSAGHTSWTAKPERDDYMTFVGFIVHYVHNLDPFRRRDEEPLTLSITLEPQPPPSNQYERPVLLLAGYSYGAMVTSQLPPLDAMLQPFISPKAESDAAEVRLRAEHLAEQQNILLGSVRSAMTHRSRRSQSSLGVRVGGSESGSPRKSHDSFGRRSFSFDAEDRIRRGVSELIGKARTGRQRHRLFHHDSEKVPETPPEPEQTKDQTLPKSPIIMPLPAYLMVSPLQGLITHLATMSLLPTAFSRAKDPESEAAEEKLVRYPTLAIYGDKDLFVTANKLRAWAERLGSRERSQFRAEEITNAGHFWVEEGALDTMRDLAGDFAQSLLPS